MSVEAIVKAWLSVLADFLRLIGLEDAANEIDAKISEEDA